MPVPIYHITHLNNLATIVNRGELCCDRQVAAGVVQATGIAHQHIKERRAKHRVTKGPAGTLSDYVPFYFAPRSPMLYAISRGNVEGYDGGQREVLHLVTDVETIVNAGLLYVFTDGHADMAFSEQFDDLAHLSRIDWEIMTAKYWRDTPQDNDRKRRRQAEFLVHEACPWDCINEIGVIDQAVADAVGTILAATNATTTVSVRPEWYY